jgi:RimJ/RimL family protein N-acetyltransferase
MTPGAGQRGGTGGTTRVGAQRRLIRPMLAPTDPADAVTAYYALYHDPRRTKLFLHRGHGGTVDGFVAVCQTGRDLFVPLAVVRSLPEDMDGLFRQAFLPGRPYEILIPESLWATANGLIETEHWQVYRVYSFEASAFRHVLNAMVQPGQRPFRYEIRFQDQVMAAAGLNWHSERMADMYVEVVPESQGRGWGKAVGSACIRDALSAGLLPTYTAADDNVPSQRLAESLGFRDSGVRQYSCVGVLRQGQ